MCSVLVIDEWCMVVRVVYGVLCGVWVVELYRTKSDVGILCGVWAMVELCRDLVWVVVVELCRARSV